MTILRTLTLKPDHQRGIDVYELYVDGAPLRALLTETDAEDAEANEGDVVGDTIPVLWHGQRFGVPEEVGVLLGERPPTVEGGRVPIYVCPVCGDIDCGAVTAVIERTPATVTWRDLRWTDAGRDDEEPIRFGGGPFVFDAAQHDAELRRFAASSRTASASRPPEEPPPAATSWWSRVRGPRSARLQPRHSSGG